MSAGADDIETLKKRLADHQRALKLQEQRAENEVQLYQRLLGRLTLACRGQNLELDNKLAQLRAQLGENSDLSKSSKLLDTVEQLLVSQAQQADKQLLSTREAIAKAGKRLQQVKGLAPQLRRDLRDLLALAESAPQSVLHYLPHLERLSALYQQALTEARGSDEGGDKAGRVATLQREMADIILALLSEIEFDRDTVTELSTLRRDIALAGCAEQLVNHCTRLIQMMIAGIKRERSMSAQFLASLNDTLQQVYGAVNRSLEQSRYLSDESRQINQTLKERISELSLNVNNTPDLNTLRDSIRDQLVLILEAIQRREQLSVQEDAINHLLEQLRGRVAALEDETEQYRSQLAEQRQQLMIDPLTQLPNRSAFEERAEIEAERFRRYGNPLAIAVIDVDHFKQINDNYGHAAGDKTLQVLGQVLSKSFRRSDFVSRFGGEEFVVLLPEQGRDGLAAPLEKLRQTIARLPFDFKGQRVTITISIGATLFTEGDTVASAFERADAELYRAKAQGRNQVSII